MKTETLPLVEGRRTEYKLAQGGLPKDIWSTISAFANTEGGKIVLGVQETKRGFEEVGVRNPSAIQEALWQGLRNPQKISVCVCRPEDVEERSVGGRSLIEITVLPAPRRNRPVFINGNPLKGTYVRRESGDYQASPEEVARLQREAGVASIDSEILAAFELGDLDHETVRSYRQRFQNRRPADPRNSDDDRRFLRYLGAFAKDRATGSEGITVAGLLMFGTETAIRDWRSRHLIDFRVQGGNGGETERWVDRVAWEGNLLGAFDKILPLLEKDLAAPFRLQGVERAEGSPLQPALREALVNLLVHADYTESQSSLILKQPSGFLFRNPGDSRVPRDLLIRGDHSDPRNPRLVRMFRYLGYAEEAGTGIPKIIKTWKDLGFEMPSIIADSSRYEFQLELRYVHLMREEDREWLASIGSGWTAAEQVALVMARHDGVVDNGQLRIRTGLHSADAGKVLTKLRDRGYLILEGSGPASRYRLGPAAVQQEGIEPELERELRKIAEPIAVQRRLPGHMADTRDQIIVELCRRQPLPIADLARLLVKSETYVADLVRDLRKARRLDYYYPGKATHPGQKYVAVDSSDQSPTE